MNKRKMKKNRRIKSERKKTNIKERMRENIE